MIKIENVDVYDLEAAIRGMRNQMNSWYKSDSKWYYDENGELETKFVIGPNDLTLMKKLVKAGSDHRKFLRMIVVYADILAPLYWWKEFDTYKVGTVRNSCSTMQKIADKRFEREDFSIEHLENCDEQHWMVCMDNIISALNVAREKYLECTVSKYATSEEAKATKKKYWWQMIQLLPSSYNQRRTVMLNYEVLTNMYHARKNHKLDEWVHFCEWIDKLPYSELITGKEEKNLKHHEK